MTEPDFVEDLASSVIREYLSRKRCPETLEMLDKELPRSPNNISNRVKLAKSLQVEPWMIQNKSKEYPFRTILEVIVSNVLSFQQYSNIATYNTNSNNNEFQRGSGSKVVSEKHLNASVSSHSDEISEERDNTENSSDKVETSYKSDIENFQSEDMNYTGLKSNSFSVEKSSLPYKTEAARKSFPKKKAASVLEMLSASPEKVISAKKSEKTEINTSQFPWDAPRPNTAREGRQRNLKHVKTEPPAKQVSEDMTKVKLDFGAKVCKNVVYDYETVKALRTLVLGNIKSTYPPEWTNQSFNFSDCVDGRTENLRFGIVQLKGGPCGILASVQALVLKHLLFESGKTNPTLDVLNVPNSVRSSCLSKVIAEVLWRASGSSTACLVLPSLYANLNTPPGYKPDGLSENLAVQNFDSFDSLLESVKVNIQSFERGRASCLLLLYSAILSRSIEMVRRDMDDPGGKLMGIHNYCTQEMINLLLTGFATSNPFDHSIQLDGSTYLKGVQKQSDIGLLSLFEHYGSCQIGKFYKMPKYPIWVVCSESHYSVLFAFDLNLVKESNQVEKFDLYYYDGLANQDEIICLTVDVSSAVPSIQTQADLIPPLEHCIRTRWKNAQISWNGSEPIL